MSENENKSENESENENQTKKQKRAEIFFVFLENFETVKIVIRHIISYRTKIRKSYKIPKVT